jgi:hypothetical protein
MTSFLVVNRHKDIGFSTSGWKRPMYGKGMAYHEDIGKTFVIIG